MPTQTRTKTKAAPQEVVELKNLLPLLARLIENGKISIRLGPIADVKDWLNNYQVFEKTRSSLSTRTAFGWRELNCSWIAGSMITRSE
jgi:hypothetical protein